jgi:hypothetical protein
MLLTGAQREAQRQPLPVHHGMDLGRQPTSGTSRAVADMSANAGPILMHADHGAVDHPQAGFFETGKASKRRSQTPARRQRTKRL